MTKSKSPKLYIGDIPNLSILSKWPNGYEAATTLAMKIAKMGIKPHNSTNAYNFETQYELFYVYPCCWCVAMAFHIKQIVKFNIWWRANVNLIFDGYRGSAWHVYGMTTGHGAEFVNIW